MTPAQLQWLRHMLGIDDPYMRVPTPWRNYAAVNPGDRVFMELEAIGAVERYGAAAEAFGTHHYYRCTEAGTLAAMLSHRTIRKSKSARVYSSYLRISDVLCDLTFHKFLVDPEFAETRRNA